MTLATFTDLLDRPQAEEHALLSALEAIPRGEVPEAIVERVLLSLEAETEQFRFSPDIRLSMIDHLPAGDLASFEVIIAHLDLVSFRDVPDEARERYHEAVDGKISRLARPYAYLDPEELVVKIAAEIIGREPAMSEQLSAEQLGRVRDVCELIMGGGHFPSYEGMTSLRDVVSVLERGL